MDRNTVVGTILILAITILFFILQSRNKPEPVLETPTAVEEQTQKQKGTPSENGTNGTAVTESNGKELPNDNQLEDDQKSRLGVFYRSDSGEEEIFTIENEKLVVKISNKGGKIESVELKDYKTHDGKPVYLAEPDRQERGFVFPQQNAPPIHTNELYFDVSGSSFAVSGEDEGQISFRLYAGDNSYFEQTYGLGGSSYVLDYNVNFVNMEEVIPSNISYIEHFWKSHLEAFEKEVSTERRYSSIYYKYRGGDVESLNLNKSDSEDADDVEWVSFKQHFFNSTLFYAEGFENSTFEVEANSEDTVYLKYYQASLRLPYVGGDQVYDMYYYLGPNHYRTLKKLGRGTEDIIQLSPDFFLFRWFSVVSKVIIIPMFNFLENFFSSYGIIILILTLIIKMALFPLTFKSYKSAAAMRVLKPEIDALKEKFGDDQQKMGAEQMKLYSSAGVNPIGGCLPMLLQMPILLAMYYFFPSSIELRQESFLWANDLSTYDSILNLPFTIPMYGSHVSLFTLLMFVSSILYASVQPQMSTGGPGGIQMKYMQYIFPVFLLVLFNSWPAALTYYYFLSNIITYLQSWAAKKFFIDEDKLRQRIQENKKKPRKKSKWQQRLEDIQKQQREVQKQKPKSKQRK